MASKKAKTEDIKKSLKIERNIESVVKEARVYKCCEKYCLNNLDDSVEQGNRMLTEYLTHWFNMSRDEHRTKFLAVLEGCVKA